MSEKYLIGVDLGTAGEKAGIFDTEGNLLAQSYRESKLIRPGPGRVEQDLDEIYSSAVKCISDCVKKAQVKPSNVAGLAFSSQMSGIGAIDENWEPAMNYDSWLDTRCEPYIFKMDEACGEKITKKTGSPPTYAHGPKILWWKNEAPEIYKRIYKFVVPYVYVAGKMAGLAAKDAYIDPTCLHFSSFSDTENRKWSKDLLSEFGVDPGKLPQIVDSKSIIGKMTKRAANQTGLIEGIPIAAGAGDQAAGPLGAGIVEPGVAFDVSGTASVFSACVDNFHPDTSNKVVLAAPSVISGLYHAFAFINGGGMNLRWFRDEFAKEEKQSDTDAYVLLDQKAKQRAPGSSKLFFLPHVQGRVCPPDPNIRGLWLGFTWGHDRIDFYRSILESIAYEYAYYLNIERSLHPTLDFSEVHTIGGGSASDFWNQIKSDILGIPYLRINVDEVGIMGDALIAGAGVGIFDDLVKTSESFVNVTDRFEPREKYHDFYKPYVDLYASLLDDYKDVFSSLADLPTVEESQLEDKGDE